MSLGAPHFDSGTKKDAESGEVSINKWYTYMCSAADDESSLNMLKDVYCAAIIEADTVMKEKQKAKTQKRRQWLTDVMKEKAPQEVENSKTLSQIWYNIKLIIFMFFHFPSLWIKESHRAPNDDDVAEGLIMSLFLACSVISFCLYYIALFVSILAAVFAFHSGSHDFITLLKYLKFSGLSYSVGLVSSLLFWDLQARKNSTLAIAIISLVVAILWG